MPVYVHVIDHPDARVLVDTGMTELHPAVADLNPRLRPLSKQDFVWFRLIRDTSAPGDGYVAPREPALTTRSCALELRQISKIYGSGASEVQALRAVDLSVDHGELVAVMGPSGCGNRRGVHPRRGGRGRPGGLDITPWPIGFS
jgi:ABC-type glutathione transport system ATPase component